MTETINQAPFKADHVGSLLRPKKLMHVRRTKTKKLHTMNYLKLKQKK